jgi:hypothetical protein
VDAAARDRYQNGHYMTNFLASEAPVLSRNWMTSDRSPERRFDHTAQRHSSRYGRSGIDIAPSRSGTFATKIWSWKQVILVMSVIMPYFRSMAMASTLLDVEA